MTTEKLRRVFASAPAEEVIIETLQLSHSRFSKVWYLSSNVSAFDAALETGAVAHFQPLPFSVKLPNSDAQGGQLLNISIANAGQEMVSEIEAAATAPNERIEVVYRIYLESDKSMPQNLPVRLSYAAELAGALVVRPDRHVGRSHSGAGWAKRRVEF